jgi:hypothetical protein
MFTVSLIVEIMIEIDQYMATYLPLPWQTFLALYHLPIDDKYVVQQTSRTFLGRVVYFARRLTKHAF